MRQHCYKRGKDISVLTNAVNELYRLNDALRIKITEMDGVPYQTITEYKEQEINVLRFKDKKELNNYAEKFAKEPMDFYTSLCHIWRRDMTPEIYLVKVNIPIDKNTFQYLLGFAHAEKHERILKQKIKQNADNMLVGEILAKVVIKKTFGIDFAKQKFAYSEYGKPYLPNFSDVHFNVSHSGKYVACAVSDKPVGVDIQKIGEYNSNVAIRVCNKNELKQIENNSDKASEFTKLWTQKEAVLKMRGTGIASGDIKNCLDNHNVQSEKFDGYWLSVTTLTNN